MIISCLVLHFYCFNCHSCHHRRCCQWAVLLVVDGRQWTKVCCQRMTFLQVWSRWYTQGCDLETLTHRKWISIGR